MIEFVIIVIQREIFDSLDVFKYLKALIDLRTSFSNNALYIVAQPWIERL